MHAGMSDRLSSTAVQQHTNHMLLMLYPIPTWCIPQKHTPEPKSLSSIGVYLRITNKKIYPKSNKKKRRTMMVH